MGLAVLHAAPSSPHSGRITFGPSARSRESWKAPVEVEYDGETWGVELDMIDAYTSDMVAFFGEVARPEWSGASKWSSEFAEITIVATRAADDLVSLAFSLWWSDGNPLDNTREGELLVRARELADFAIRVRDLTEIQGPVHRLGSAT